MQQKSLWQQVERESVQLLSAEQRLPEKYLVFRLNQTSLKNSLADLPLEKTDAAQESPLIMEVPMPDGSIQRFRMEETQVLAPHLAAEFPDWKTFTGYGIDNPQAVGQFDWTTNGFHGYISTGRDTAMIDPYQKGDTENYLVYNKSEYGAPDTEFYCNVEKTMKKITETDYKTDFLPDAPEFTFGRTVRTFRIAIATTGEWSRNAAGVPPNTNPTLTPNQIRVAAFNVVTTTVNRLNGIYLRELASKFTLVNPALNNNQTNIIFDDPATDPYNNTDQADDTTGNVNQLRVNQETLDNRVGTGQYDIGHLYGTGGGGVAYRGSLCQNGTVGGNTQYNNIKAGGYSARGMNTGDPFVVDYVAHEIGHQFGASHTYNNSDPDPNNDACTTRSATTAFEVASGATIMSYVGICASRNLQQYVDTGFPSFHTASLTEINTNLTTGAPNDITPCGTSSGTNSVPTVSAGATYTIPRLTPFTLTATGADADGNDVANLLYSWEEYDLAPSASGVVGTPPGTYDVDDDGVLRPLLRPYSPVAETSRIFPSLTFILNPQNNDQTANVNGVAGNQPVLTYTGTHPTGKPGAVCAPGMTCVVGERLPTVSRTMNFRVSLRDRRGGVADAGTTVTIANGAGPFQVTVQNTPETVNKSESILAPEAIWQGGSAQTVTWDVAGTNAAPINAANVNILLSTDGGQTFPITILANTPNDGTQQITVPNNPTTTARIKVEAVGNIFFDINNANFTITAQPTAAGASVFGRVLSLKGRGISNASIVVTNQNGEVRFARTNSFGYYNLSEVATGQTYIFAVKAKGYQFAPQTVSLTENLDGLNFTAQR